MGERLRELLLRVLRVPARPEPPLGSAASNVLTFRAAPRYFHYRVARWALGQVGTLAALIAGVIFLRSVADYPALSPWASGWVLLEVWAWSVFLLQLPVGYMMLRLDFEMRWYLLSDRSLRIREGLLVVREKTMTYANIQNISIHRNPLQRIFGLATVAVRAAGGGGSESPGGNSGSHTHEAHFEGVDNADRIREILRQRIRLHRDSGLGDPDDVSDEDVADVRASQAEAPRPDDVTGAGPAAATPDVVAAARAVLDEVVALRAGGGLTAYGRSRP